MTCQEQKYWTVSCERSVQSDFSAGRKFIRCHVKVTLSVRLIFRAAPYICYACSNLLSTENSIWIDRVETCTRLTCTGADSEVWNRVYMIDSVTDRLQGCGLFTPCEQRFISGIALTRAESFIASLSFALFALFFYKLQLHLPSRLQLLMGPRAVSLAFLWKHFIGRSPPVIGEFSLFVLVHPIIKLQAKRI